MKKTACVASGLNGETAQNARERVEKRFHPILLTALPLICLLDKQNRQLRWLTRILLHVWRKRLFTIHT